MKLTRRQLKNIILKEFSTTRADWEDGTFGLCRQLKRSGMSDSEIDALCAGADMSDPTEDEDEPQEAEDQNPPRKDKDDAILTTIKLNLHKNTNEKVGESKQTLSLVTREKIATKAFGLKSYKRLKSWTWNIEGGAPVTITLADVNNKIENK